MTLQARLEILPPPQRALWPELAAIPARFVLYGGTAIALRLAHRQSVDFDLFSHAPLDHRELDRLALMREATVIEEGPNERTVLVDRGGPIKISWFGGITFGRLGSPDETSDRVMRVASLIDLGATKVKVLLQRVESKDYRDLAALLEAGLSLGDILGAARTLFGDAFNPLVAQKAICYFEGGDLDTLEHVVRDRLTVAAAQDLTVDPLPRTSDRLDQTL